LREVFKDRKFLLDQVASVAGGVTSDTKTKTERAKKAEELKDSLNTEFEIYEIHQQRLLKILDKNVNDENLSFSDRLASLTMFVNASKSLLDKEEQNEINAARKKAAKESSGANSTNRAIIEENLQQEILLIQAKYADKGIELAESSSNKRIDILDKEKEDMLKIVSDFYDQEQRYIDDVNARREAERAARIKKEKEDADKKKQQEK
jgi:uncharacterized protein (UPF0147 family)